MMISRIKLEQSTLLGSLAFLEVDHVRTLNDEEAKEQGVQALRNILDAFDRGDLELKSTFQPQQISEMLVCRRYCFLMKQPDE